MTNFIRLSFFTVLLCSCFQAQAIIPNVDLRDVIRFGSAQDKAEAQALIARVNQSPASFGLPDGISYSTQILNSIGQAAVSTIEIQNVSSVGYDVFLIYALEKQSWLNKVNVDASGNVTTVLKTDLTRNPPTAQIDILNRQMVLSERRSGFVKFAPVSLGSLTNIRLGDSTSGLKSLSSTFNRAVLSRSKSELSRAEPTYYRSRPFLRIVDQDQEAFGGFTPFGLHYQISENFERGFVSNGCFRLRDTDLYELATMVFFSRKGGVPLSVVASTSNGNRHPYPLINTWYNSPRTTIDAQGRPAYVTIEHGLFQFDKKIGQPEYLLGAH